MKCCKKGCLEPAVMQINFNAINRSVASCNIHYPEVVAILKREVPDLEVIMVSDPQISPAIH